MSAPDIIFAAVALAIIAAGVFGSAVL